MHFLHNFSLLSLNTFHINARANLFASIAGLEDIKEVLSTREFKENKSLILGGGSNVLFKSDYDGLVLKNEIKGITVVDETQDHVFVKYGSGEDWHGIVLHAIKNDWYGLENLSLIPGTVGAAPIQNIGAYGVELKDVFYQLTAILLDTGVVQTFNKDECDFGYRQSIFKSTLKSKIIIDSVTLKLSKKPNFNLTYHPLAEYFRDRKKNDISASEVSNAVVEIRKSKLPDPEEIGNGGSFFKNPVVNKKIGAGFLTAYPGAPVFQNEDGSVKIPAAFLIQECGWKGKRIGDAGVHKLQPLVLVNYGTATGNDIISLSKNIQQSVFDKFQIKLEPEVNII